MERLKNMDRYQKGILFLLLVMAVGFAVAYGLVTSRVGYLYGDAILVPSQENGTTVYTGTVREYDASVIVTADKTVTFRFGNLLYGPYTAKEDPTAIPENEDMSAYMTGIQVLENGKVFFRGAVLPVASDSIHWMLYDENGNLDDISIVAYTSNGVQLDSSGNSSIR